MSKKSGMEKVSKRLGLTALKEGFKEVWRYGTGKIGIVMLVVLVSIAISAVIVLPPNFPSLWNNIKAWQENPKLVPPAWVSYLGVPAIQQFEQTIPGSQYAVNMTTTHYYTVPVLYYTLNYNLNKKVFPTGLLFEIQKIKLLDRYRAYNITSGERYKVPTIIITITRPDGIKMVLYDGTPSILYEKNITGETYIYVDHPLYISPTNVINADEVQKAFQKIYNVTVNLAAGMGNVYKLSNVVFGKPVARTGAASNITFVPLEGTYTVSIYFVTLPNFPVALATPPAGSIKAVIKGSVYGVMGTDTYGRDLALGLYFGFPVALSIGLVVAFLDTVIGVIVGAISGYYGGLVDEFIQRTVDVLGNIPLLPILIIIGEIARQLYPNNPVLVIWIILLTIVIFSWGGLTIVIRSMTLSIKGEQYVEAAKCLGASNKRIIFLHIIPQVIPYAVASMVFSVPAAILTVAGLAVLGIIKNMPSWGTILADARANAAITDWWWIIPPGILIAITSLTFVLIGMALERIVEPRLRTR